MDLRIISYGLGKMSRRRSPLNNTNQVIYSIVCTNFVILGNIVVYDIIEKNSISFLRESRNHREVYESRTDCSD